MNILEELKLSKKQNNDKRYDYLCEQFNVVDYAIKLEKYTNNLLRKNKKQKEVIDKIYELIKQYIRKNGFLELNEWQTRDLLTLLKEVSE